MAVFLNIVVPGLAIVAIGATFYFGVRAFRYKASLSRQPYNVGQQHTRRAMQVDMLRAGVSLVVALMMLAAIGFSPNLTATEAESVGEEAVVETVIPTTELLHEPTSLPDTAVPTQAPIIETQPTATVPSEPVLPTAVPTVTSVPTVIPISPPQTAVVNSEVGVWLRSAPSTAGEQAEWLLNGTELIVLPGKQSADDLEWQQVRAPSGNEGWVASLYITYNE